MYYQECGIHPVHLATDQEIVWRNHQKLKSLFQISRGACHAMAFFHMATICNVTVSKDESGHYLMIVGIPCPSGWSTKWLDVHIAALFTLQSGSWHNSHCTRLSLPCIVCRWYANTWHENTRLWKTRHWKDYALQVLMLCVALMYFLSKALHCTAHLTKNTRLWGFVYRVSTLSTHSRLWKPMRRGNFWWYMFIKCQTEMCYRSRLDYLR